MKYAIIIPDGAADEPQASLGGRTPLEAAIARGGFYHIERLIKAGADPNRKSGKGETPLVAYLKTRSGHSDNVARLLNLKADPAIRDDLGRHALFYAALPETEHYRTEHDQKIIELLLDQGLDINDRDTRGATPLMLAAENGRDDLVPLMIEKGARVACAESCTGASPGPSSTTST